MRDSKGTRSALWAVVLTLIVANAAPILAAPLQGQGRGQEKKAEKFKNRHDARDGRWDGRGPRDDRNDDDDDRDNDRDEGRGRDRDRDRERDRDDDDRDRDRNNGRHSNPTEIRRQALGSGYREGVRAGQSDRASGRSRDVQGHEAFRDATIGYHDSFGNRDLYRRSFRDGFRRGYEEGFRQRTSRQRGRGALGDILGRQ